MACGGTTPSSADPLASEQLPSITLCFEFLNRLLILTNLKIQSLKSDHTDQNGFSNARAGYPHSYRCKSMSSISHYVFVIASLLYICYPYGNLLGNASFSRVPGTLVAAAWVSGTNRADNHSSVAARSPTA